jgi:hypothetical protein
MDHWNKKQKREGRRTMRFIKHLLLLGVVLLSACENKDLFPLCDTTGETLVEVIIHWEDTPASAYPESMRTLWYAQDGNKEMYDKLFNVYGGYDRLPASEYTPLCFDYYGNALLDFRGFGSAGDFEVYNLPASSLYNQYANPLPDEPTVAEAASPYLFYVDGRPQTVDTESLHAGDTLRVHFYPENVLREFTFVIYDVQSVQKMAKNSGAITGMSASYFLAENRLATSPSTILFSRVKATGDRIAGRFCTFGPVNVEQERIRLTVEALSVNNYYYFGAWEKTVSQQIKSSMEGSGTGSFAERQAWWRERNGGFDIVLANEGQLEVSDDGGGPSGNGGFEVGADEWVTTPVPVD